MDPGMECTVVNSRQCHGLHIGEGILLKSTWYEPMHPSPPATASAHAKYIPMNRLHPLAEITNLLRPEFPTSSNRVRYKLLQYFPRNDLRALMDPGLITYLI